MNLLTFEIVDWFHTHRDRQFISGHIWKELPKRVDVNTIRILELLDQFNIKATFFVLGWVAEYHPELVKKIFEAGHEIAAYSNWNHRANRLTPEDFEKDLVMCLSRLQNVIGDPITTYRAPGFSLKVKDQWAFDILARNGITIDSSVQLYGSKYKAPYMIKAIDKNIMEFPLLKTNLGFPYSGGGYLRVLPLNLLLKYFENSTYNLFYLRPRDFDEQNPHSNLFSTFRNLFNRYNTGTTTEKLSVLLNKFPITTMGDEAIKFNVNR